MTLKMAVYARNVSWLTKVPNVVGFHPISWIVPLSFRRCFTCLIRKFLVSKQRNLVVSNLIYSPLGLIQISHNLVHKKNLAASSLVRQIRQFQTSHCINLD